MRSQPDERVCVTCGAAFLAAKPSSSQKHCARACAVRANAAERAKPKAEIICRGCGQVFLAFPYLRGRKWYCSKACAPGPPRKAKSGGRVTVRCCTCGVAFDVWRYRAQHSGRYFCSPACKGVSQVRRPPRSCTVCGRLFRPQKSQVDAGQGKYCSIPCRSVGVANMANYGRFGYRYRQWRLAVLSRDGRTCQTCGATGVLLHTHHIKDWWHHINLRFEVSNGTTLCKPCHDALHGTLPHAAGPVHEKRPS
jgi:hypothetical protein